MSRRIILAMLPLVSAALPALASPLKPTVVTQELIYDTKGADNGAGPLWCYGSTCIVRRGEDVYVAGLETIPDLKPLNNCHWTLFHRTPKGWEVVRADDTGRTREPCPLGILADGKLMLSANPTLTQPNTYSGPADPQVLQFAAADPKAPPGVLHPRWLKNPGFSEHSYRGLSIDGPHNELLLFNIYMYNETYWSFLDRKGRWFRTGKLTFPEADYADPCPTRIRLCYPEIALRGRAVHYLGVSDIMEPVKAWLDYKYELTKQHWDYEFRRLFYTWTPDITQKDFAPFIEIASNEKTGGHCWNMDIWLDKDGAAHLLWVEESLDNRLRPKFVPKETPWTKSLHTCVVKEGKVVSRDLLALGGEGQKGESAHWARLHATPEGRLFAFYYCSGTDAKGKGFNENRIIEILPDGTHGTPVRVPLQHPFNNFMTATERGGSAPSHTLDAYGTVNGKPGFWYACIEL